MQTQSADPIQVVCSSTTRAEGEVVVQVQIKNVSDATLHLFDSARMPYVLLQADESLLILYGVNPPDPNKDYFTIEIPITRPLAPGAVIENEVSLTPLYLGHHYGLARQRSRPTVKHGTTTVYCEVGWGKTPILPAKEEKSVRNISQLLEWQHTTQAEAIPVELP